MCAAAPHLNIIVLVTLRQIISREKKEQNDFLTTKQTPCVCVDVICAVCAETKETLP